MCGIAGYLGGGNIEDLRVMMSLMIHRGPDDSGTYIDDGIGLANTRLSIVGIESGHQPLCGENGKVWVTFNGEIFNFMRERRRLEELGHSFTTSSDTEVIVHLYEEYGASFVSRLNGMFAFALWDSETKTLQLARDYAGMKPLYYHWSDSGTLYFASEIKCLVRLGRTAAIDLESLPDVLVLGYIPYERTIFEGIYKLRPGSYITIRGSDVSVSQYNDFQTAPLAGDSSDPVTLLSRELRRAAYDWMMSDVPVGAYLSGGIDSSVITALAAGHSLRPLDTFTAWFGPDYHNERGQARAVAEHIRSNHHEVLVEASEVIKEIPRIVWAYDEPIADAAVIPTYFVSREASLHVKVALAGEGSDEIFGGYPWHRIFSYFDPYSQQTSGIHSGTPYRNHTAQRISSLLWPGYSFAQRYVLFHSIISPARVRREFANVGPGRAVQAFAQYLERRSGTFLSRVLLCDTLTLLAESFMMKADKGSMANSVEERTPYLDKPLMELAFRMPDRSKISLGEEKIALRRAARDILPKQTIGRRKQGYGTPVSGWVKGEVGDYFEDLIDRSFLLRKTAGRKYLSRVSRLRKFQPKQFWLLGSIAAWEATYLDKSGDSIANG